MTDSTPATAAAHNLEHGSDVIKVTTPATAAPCPVAYCRGEAGHRDLHDIAPCLSTCEWVIVGVSRKHDLACPNAQVAGITPDPARSVRRD